VGSRSPANTGSGLTCLCFAGARFQVLLNRASVKFHRQTTHRLSGETITGKPPRRGSPLIFFAQPNQSACRKSRSARESFDAQPARGYYAAAPNRAGTTVEALVALVLWQAPPCRLLLQPLGHRSQVAGRTILPKVSFDIPRGTTLETFASRSVRKGKIARADAGKPRDGVNSSDCKPLCRLVLMLSVVRLVATASDAEK
jgi:hypothetical protein